MRAGASLAALLSLALPLTLAACGDLPRPFEGNPGRTALRLAQPPPSRLAVPVPAESLLPDAAAATLAKDMAAALAAKEVPAVAGTAQPGDWRLRVRADLRGDQVIPTFTVLNPKGQAQGSTSGGPVPAAAWGNGDPAVVAATAQAAAPALASLLTSIEAARLASDPNSLMNRPARLVLAGVTGAPGDGNAALAREIRSQLANDGIVVQDDGNGADFTLKGNVVMATVAGGQQRVEITWTVDDAGGKEDGKVVQLNDVPAGTLDAYWGDVALVVAQQAASGIKQVIVNHVGPRPETTSAATSAATPAATPAAAPAHAADTRPAAIPVHGQGAGGLLEGAGSRLPVSARPGTSR